MKIFSFIITLLALYSISSCNTIKVARYSTPPPKPDTCFVAIDGDPFHISDSSNNIYKSYYDTFFHSTNVYDIAYTETIEGRTSTFKSISLDTSETITFTIKSGYEKETRKIIKDEKLYSLIKAIGNGYLSTICIDRYMFHSQYYKLLLRRKGETYYTLYLSHTPITDFIEEDRAKIQNGYDLINYLRSLK